jgi:hypothetical protein
VVSFCECFTQARSNAATTDIVIASGLDQVKLSNIFVERENGYLVRKGTLVMQVATSLRWQFALSNRWGIERGYNNFDGFSLASAKFSGETSQGLAGVSSSQIHTLPNEPNTAA